MSRWGLAVLIGFPTAFLVIFLALQPLIYGTRHRGRHRGRSAWRTPKRVWR